MLFNSAYIGWIIVIGLAALLNVWLVRWVRENWQVDETSPHVRVWGQYSPVLTWLKYRRLPPVKRRPSPAPENVGGAPAAFDGQAAPTIQESFRMASTEIPVSPAAPADNPAALAPEAPPARAASPVKPEARGRLAVVLAVLGLALIGQFYLSSVQDAFRDGLMFFAAAIVLFVILVRQAEAAPAVGPSLAARARSVIDHARSAPVQTALIVLSFALAYTTIRFLRAKPGPGSYWDVFTVWVVSFLCYGAAFARPLRGPMRLDMRAWARQHRREIILVAALTAAAAAARFWALGAVPNILSGDEGVLGTLSQAVARGDLNNMLATVYGTSTFYLFVLAGVERVLGFTPFGLRFTSALVGTLSIPVLYLLARRMFNARVALVAAVLMAASHIHLHFSRIIVASSLQDAFWAMLALYFFYTGLEKRSAPRMAFSGLVMGWHLYIYMGARLMILLMPVYVTALWVTNRKLVEENVGGLLAFAGGLLVIGAPMGWWAYYHWDEFMARANQIGIIQSGWLANEAQITGKGQLSIFLDLLRQAFLTVNYYPARAGYNSKYPMLDFVSGAFFMLGLAYSLYHATDRRHLM